MGNATGLLGLAVLALVFVLAFLARRREMRPTLTHPLYWMSLFSVFGLGGALLVAGALSSDSASNPAIVLTVVVTFLTLVQVKDYVLTLLGVPGDTLPLATVDVRLVRHPLEGVVYERQLAVESAPYNAVLAVPEGDHDGIQVAGASITSLLPCTEGRTVRSILSADRLLVDGGDIERSDGTVNQVTNPDGFSLKNAVVEDDEGTIREYEAVELTWDIENTQGGEPPVIDCTTAVELEKEYPPDGDPIELRSEYELVYFRIRYDPWGPEWVQQRLREFLSAFMVRFETVRWWIYFPHGYRVLQSEDVAKRWDSERVAFRPPSTTLCTDEVWLDDARPPTYDNLAFGYDEAKNVVMRRNWTHGELEDFAPGSNSGIEIITWVRTPDPSSEPADYWYADDYIDKSGVRRGLRSVRDRCSSLLYSTEDDGADEDETSAIRFILEPPGVPLRREYEFPVERRE